MYSLNPNRTETNQTRANSTNKNIFMFQDSFGKIAAIWISRETLWVRSWNHLYALPITMPTAYRVQKYGNLFYQTY